MQSRSISPMLGYKMRALSWIGSPAHVGLTELERPPGWMNGPHPSRRNRTVKATWTDRATCHTSSGIKAGAADVRAPAKSDRKIGADFWIRSSLFSEKRDKFELVRTHACSSSMWDDDDDDDDNDDEFQEFSVALNSSQNSKALNHGFSPSRCFKFSLNEKCFFSFGGLRSAIGQVLLRFGRDPVF